VAAQLGSVSARRSSGGKVQVRRLDLARQPLGVAVADAAAEPPLHVVVDHLRQTAELPLDGLGLAHQHLEHPVLGALRQLEIVAADRLRRLQLAVDPAVPLLDAARVPGQVEVEEVGAVCLEVEALAGGVGGEEDAQRVLRRIRVEAALDLLAALRAGQAVDELQAILRPLGSLDRLLEHGSQVATLQPQVLPSRSRSARMRSRRSTSS
jgi:hypothetical protein